MAADVGYLVRILSRYKDDRTAAINDSTGTRSTVALMTRDLLGTGGCGGEGKDDQSLELDLDLKVPNGWEKRLDLKSGKVYLQQCNTTTSSSSTHQTVPRFQDLNFPPISGKSPAKPLLSLFDDDTSLELKLVPSTTSLSRPPPSCSSSSSPSSSSSSYPYLSSLSVSSSSTKPSFQSVCTLDKVKSALERAEKDTSSGVMMIKKRQSPEDGVCDRNASASAAASSSSSPVAAGCPGCLSYVLVMKNNPKCPRCQSFVPLPSMKKPKIDLNISI